MLHWGVKQLGRCCSRNKLSILIYHQVFEQRDPMRPSEPDVAEFSWQMALLQRYFTPLPLAEAVQRLQNNDLPANAVCVTFDDGYVNNLQVAQPVLQQYGIPATVFVATGFSHGANMWNDRLFDLVGHQEIEQVDLSAFELSPAPVSDWQSRRNLASKLIPEIKYRHHTERTAIIDQLYRDNQMTEFPARMMTPEQVQQLAGCGVEIGAHTQQHPILAAHNPAEQQQQITQSKTLLEQWLQRPVQGFAYPNGKPGSDYTEASVSLVEKAGFDYAVSTEWGISTPQTDRFQLRRFTPWDKTPGKFHLRLIKNMLG